MKPKNQTESRNTVLANLWMKHGCPEKMTIHVGKTRETIVLINGIPLEPQTRVTDKPCAVCSRPLPEGRQKFCSPKCSQRHKSELRRLRLAKQAEAALQIFTPEKGTEEEPTWAA